MKVSDLKTATAITKTFVVLLFLLFLQVILVSCKKDDEAKPDSQRMTLTATLDGKPWQANGFLVQRSVATVTSDAALEISSRSSTGAIRMHLYLYGVDKTGTYSVNSSQNTKQQDARLEITGTPEGFSSFFGWGPATYTVTKVEGKRYTGAFTASFFDVTRNKTITVADGKFDVWEGNQPEE